MKRLLLALALIINLSGCSSMGKFMTDYSDYMKEAEKNAPVRSYTQQTNCQSYVYGNSVSTSCY